MKAQVNTVTFSFITTAAGSYPQANYAVSELRRVLCNELREGLKTQLTALKGIAGISWAKLKDEETLRKMTAMRSLAFVGRGKRMATILLSVVGGGKTVYVDMDRVDRLPESSSCGGGIDMPPGTGNPLKCLISKAGL